MTKALINPQIAAWARIRAGLQPEELAKALNVKPEKIEKWESGNENPTFNQAIQLAASTHIPFGFLYLDTPPEETLPLPDLRTKHDAPLDKPSIDLIEVVKHVLWKQSWYIDYCLEQNYPPLDFIGKFSIKSKISEVVSDIKSTLNFNGVHRGNGDEYFNSLITAAENAGILVMRSGIVGNNTHRKLSVNEFRGFAISNKYAPVIFINIADAPTARLFTLVHELSHLWIGVTGISNIAWTNDKQEEKFCNAVAGEFLVPENMFHAIWNDNAHPEENFSYISHYFHVSKLVVSKRARDLGKISNDQYTSFYKAELERFRNKQGGGGNFYSAAGTKNSHKFSKAVLAEAFSGRLLYRDAGKLLGISPNKLKTYSENIGI